MSKFDKIKIFSTKYDLYKNLLTDRQREIFEYYYFQDLSMVEISEILHISRSAVNDSLKHTEKILENYDKKLNN